MKKILLVGKVRTSRSLSLAYFSFGNMLLFSWLSIKMVHAVQ